MTGNECDGRVPVLKPLRALPGPGRMARPFGDRSYGIGPVHLRGWRGSFSRWWTVLPVSPIYTRKSLPAGRIRQGPGSLGMCRHSWLPAVNGTHGDQARDCQFYEKYSLSIRSAGCCGSGSGDKRDQGLYVERDVGCERMGK